jgi:hypothetical protein
MSVFEESCDSWSSCVVCVQVETARRVVVLLEMQRQQQLVTRQAEQEAEEVVSPQYPSTIT